jgi:hypothetical protein
MNMTVNWCLEVERKAQEIIAEESTLLKETYRGGNFAEFATKTGLYFSFGDIAHFIHSSVRLSVTIRMFGGAAGIACFEDLVKRLRLYLIAELKRVLANQEPYNHERGPDHHFIVDFLELFKELDQLKTDLAAIREKEGGYYQ